MIEKSKHGGKKKARIPTMEVSDDVSLYWLHKLQEMERKAGRPIPQNAAFEMFIRSQPDFEELSKLL